jgi:hypothetical protein
MHHGAPTIAAAFTAPHLLNCGQSPVSLRRHQHAINPALTKM